MSQRNTPSSVLSLLGLRQVIGSRVSTEADVPPLFPPQEIAVPFTQRDKASKMRGMAEG